MLADSPIAVHAGEIETDILLPGTARYELIDFIAKELPRWRDHPSRPKASAETTLTDQLCDHLNSATYYSTTWSHVQFRTEVPDEVRSGRKIDLAAKPRAAKLLIGGMRYGPFDTVLPIECKRLPTPKESGRDEREYVITEPGTTGGIQRFKFGHHGAAHNIGAMVAYVQDQTVGHWVTQVNGWIRSLSAKAGSAWSDSDLLQQQSDDSTSGICTLCSRHSRPGGLDECETASSLDQDELTVGRRSHRAFPPSGFLVNNSALPPAWTALS